MLQELGVFVTLEGTMNITLYSPYWMVNKTDLYLEYTVRVYQCNSVFITVLPYHFRSHDVQAITESIASYQTVQSSPSSQDIVQ